MYNFGDVVLAQVQFTNSLDVKIRPALVLFQEYGNIVVAGITSNQDMKGIPLPAKEGAYKDSVIKLNYIFTISENMVRKQLFVLTAEKKRIVRDHLMQKLS